MITTDRPARRPAPADQADTQDAERLIALARACTAAGITRRCLVLRLSLLPADLAKPHHLRLARDAIIPLLIADRAQAFTLANRDLAVVWRGQAADAVATARDAIGRLFADAPAEAPDPAALWLLLELPAQTDTLVHLVEASTAAAEPDAAPAGPALPLDAAALERLESALGHADMARFARRRQVLALSPSGVFVPAWETRSLSVDEIAAALAPDRAPRADPWLFARLTRTLDRRMLALLADPNELHGAGPFGLDLNVVSILAPDFLRFDAALPQGLRGQVTLALRPGDILSDLSAFLLARDFARARGYRLMLRLGSAELLEMLPLDRIGLDLLQLGWSPALPVLHPAVLEPVAARVVLTRTDTPDGIAWGRAQGVRLFAGRPAIAGRIAPGLTLARS